MPNTVRELLDRLFALTTLIPSVSGGT
jgi:hypothetical protein